MQGGLAGLAAVGLSGTLDLNQAGAAALAKGKTIKFGYVSPETGPLAPFGAADAFVISALKSLLAKGVTIKGVNYPIEIIVKDSQSTDATAATVAEDLIKNDKVDIMLVSSTPDTTNPVSDQCEANQVPCISTVAPWQSWFSDEERLPRPNTSGRITSSGAWRTSRPCTRVSGARWRPIRTSVVCGPTTATVVPSLLPPRASRRSPGRSATTSRTRVVTPMGQRTLPRRSLLTATETARYLTGVPIPPDFTTFYKQAASQGYIPKVATIAKAMLFPSSAQALGSLAENIGTEYWWGPTHPFTSSLTKQNCAHIAAAYEKQTGDQWTQPIGFVHALFEVAIATIKQSGEAHNKAAFVSTLSKLKVNTIVGPLNWQTGPVPNVTKTPLVGGQWRAGNTKSGYALVIVTNNGHTNIPVASAPQAISGATV